MKKTNTLLFTCLLFLCACQAPSEQEAAFRLLPSPQQFDISGVSGLKPADLKFYAVSGAGELPARGDLLKNIQEAKTPAQAQIVFGLDPALDLKPEGYTLKIAENQVTITGKDQAGLLYGFMTLEQLMEDATDQNVNLPLCRITDFPLLAYRAIHIDVKHHMEKKDYYYQLMDRLAKLKVNAVIVELEDKIRYERQPAVGSSDAWSIGEWKALSDYARARNIEISPLVQGLGHASFILKHEQYKDLRDDPESDWAFNPLNPKTYDVQFDLYRDAIAATPHGKYLHVGGDEVHTTGRNSGKSPLELQMIWLNKVCAFAEANGRTPIFWDDMPLKFAGVYDPMFDPGATRRQVDSTWEKNEANLLKFLDQFPRNCVYMRWNYETPGTYGNLKTMDWFISHGLKVMGATAGQTRWVLMPQNQSNMENIRSFALSSVEKGLNGLLLTLWDDDSPHFELYGRGIMAFAEYAWAGDKRTVAELKEAHRHRAFGPGLSGEEYGFIDRLEEPVGYWKELLVKDGASRNDLMTMTEDGTIGLPDPHNKGKWSEQYADRLARAKAYLQTCDSVSAQIAEMKEKTLRNRYTLEVYEQVNELLRYTFEWMTAMEQYDRPSDITTEEQALKNLSQHAQKFNAVRSRLEEVYSKTRILTKPAGYQLDQDHHRHSANQSTSFDWQFVAELALLRKMAEEGVIR